MWLLGDEATFACPMFTVNIPCDASLGDFAME
jgi:hypothetical protein